jgi:hypothetical protein
MKRLLTIILLIATTVSMMTAQTVRRVRNGIILVDSGKTVRAIEPYKGNMESVAAYAGVVNKYKRTFPHVNVYCMVIPNAVAFYCPETAREWTNDERPYITRILSGLSADVKAVDIYETLQAHAHEPIYSRTDHHWAPLGAFYAAQHFAQVADVGFKDLSAYEPRVIHDYVGSMYTFSRDRSVKEAPEDFVYYVPKGVEYTTTYTDYTIDENYHVIGMGRPYKSAFFFRFKDGSGGAYCTFMGGDSKIVKVETSTRNGRRILFIKDSFGNAIPGYLFYSFEDVFVVDNRYFHLNMKDYVGENGITDILFACSVFNAYGNAFSNNCQRLLKQKAGSNIVK